MTTRTKKPQPKPESPLPFPLVAMPMESFAQTVFCMDPGEDYRLNEAGDRIETREGCGFKLPKGLTYCYDHNGNNVWIATKEVADKVEGLHKQIEALEDEICSILRGPVNHYWRESVMGEGASQ